MDFNSSSCYNRKLRTVDAFRLGTKSISTVVPVTTGSYFFAVQSIGNPISEFQQQFLLQQEATHHCWPGLRPECGKISTVVLLQQEIYRSQVLVCFNKRYLKYTLLPNTKIYCEFYIEFFFKNQLKNCMLLHNR